MRHWRLILLAILFATPTLILIGLGVYHAWERGWWFWLWWPLAACLGLGYFLAWRWQRGQRLFRLNFDVPIHWTERDKQAWKLVESRARSADKLSADQLTDVNFYLDTGKEMALELARFYSPRVQDPIGSLTIPEILAVVELASHDLAEMVERYVPGGHLMTVNNWRRAKQLSDWYQTATTVGWIVAGLFAPLNTGIRYLASQVGLQTPLQKLQFNLQVWFYGAFVHRVGTYLIDLHSGRLRVGAARYRQLLAQAAGAADGQTAAEPAATGAPPIPRVVITLLGQVKAGKSSLVNALLGEQRAKTDVIRATAEITRYQLQPEGVATPLQVLDTVGYGHAGPGPDQLQATREAATESDLLLLVVHATNPARQADLELLQGLRRYFDTQPQLRMPPVLAVLTHIDLLSPSLEWSPPYNLEKPTRTKEERIVQATAAVGEQLGDLIAGVIPVCVAADKIYGVQEWLLPAMISFLDEARGVALLRCLKTEAEAGKFRKVFQQLFEAGKEGLKIYRELTRK